MANSMKDSAIGRNVFAYLSLDNVVDMLERSHEAVLDLDKEEGADYIQYLDFLDWLEGIKVRLWDKLTPKERDMYANHMYKLYEMDIDVTCGGYLDDLDIIYEDYGSDEDDFDY